MPPRVTLPPTTSDARRIKRSRVLSYVLVVLAAVVFSLRPELFGDPQAQPAHALLHVWRIVAGIVLVLAALAVQIVVGVRWRAGLRRSAEVDSEPPGNRARRDR
jgi:cbb3-type cytochrome oxidase subunit 1